MMWFIVAFSSSTTTSDAMPAALAGPEFNGKTEWADNSACWLTSTLDCSNFISCTPCTQYWASVADSWPMSILTALLFTAECSYGSRLTLLDDARSSAWTHPSNLCRQAMSSRLFIYMPSTLHYACLPLVPNFPTVDPLCLPPSSSKFPWRTEREPTSHSAQREIWNWRAASAMDWPP